MKSRLLFSLISFYCINSIITSPLEKFTDNPAVLKSNTWNDLTTTPTPSTTPPFSQDDLDGISIQDIPSLDIDTNEKIENKIINVVSEFSSNCNAYKEIDLSIDNFIISKDYISILLGTEIAIFYNFIVTTDESDGSNKKLYSTSMKCDSSKMGKVEVKLPKRIKITADLKVLQNSNSLKEFSTVVKTGSISLTLKNSSILNQFSVVASNSTNQENDTGELSRIIYSDSEVHLNADIKFQMAIYSQLETFFNELESPIKQSFVEKLNEKLLQNRISVADICSKFITPDKSPKKVNLPFFNNNLNNLYVISNAKLETWKSVILSAGPIIIDGLSSFNSTEFTVINSPVSSPDGDGYYYRTTPKYDEPELKEMTVRIKTNELKGNLHWSYNNKQKSFPFFVEFVQFEMKKSKRFTYEGKEGWQLDRYGTGRYYPPGSYMRSDKSEFDVNLNLGGIRIKSSVYENENEFVQFVLSEYLKSAITDSIKDSLNSRQAHHIRRLFSNCDLFI